MYCSSIIEDLIFNTKPWVEFFFYFNIVTRREVMKKQEDLSDYMYEKVVDTG